MSRRRVCFVTGTRAEFGLMATALRAIRSHSALRLQIVVTGMHLDRRRGGSIDQILRDGWKIDLVVPWRGGDSPADRAAATGRATHDLARAFASLRPDIVLVVGDRVEAFAAAAAAHLSDIPVAHVHGGDRALGQADDSLRHAITKLAHLHFPATNASAARLRRLGEDRWRIVRCGAPGIDDIRSVAAPPRATRTLLASNDPFALLVLHPTDPNDAVEHARATMILRTLLAARLARVAIVHPNNDPGSGGIARAWDEVRDDRVTIFRNLDRPAFLGLLRDAAFLIGNSSAGIIEAASFGTPVIDIGPRQAGRERGRNVAHVESTAAAVRRAIDRIGRSGRPKRFPARNTYGGRGAGRKIAQALASVQLDARLLRKLIAY
jgi:UDP-N-acetylglucosamine 2-epimerase (non-hydrolysing)/GDP/UDP-N,N'-diacetylbacillosamine 2-epimerase (hydrolysing)